MSDVCGKVTSAEARVANLHKSAAENLPVAPYDSYPVML